MTPYTASSCLRSFARSSCSLLRSSRPAVWERWHPCKQTLKGPTRRAQKRMIPQGTPDTDQTINSKWSSRQVLRNLVESMPTPYNHCFDLEKDGRFVCSELGRCTDNLAYPPLVALYNDLYNPVYSHRLLIRRLARRNQHVNLFQPLRNRTSYPLIQKDACIDTYKSIL